MMPSNLRLVMRRAIGGAVRPAGSSFFCSSTETRSKDKCNKNIISNDIKDINKKIDSSVEPNRQVAQPPQSSPSFREVAHVGVYTFIALTGLSIAHISMFAADNTMLLGSFGASCFVLCLSPTAPMAQPRNVIGGHIVGTSCGLASHLCFGYFQTLADVSGVTAIHGISEAINVHMPTMTAGPIAVSLAAMVMMLTKTVHFPAGGTALGVALSPEMTCSVSELLVSPATQDLFSNVLLSSSTLVAMATFLHGGSYPNGLSQHILTKNDLTTNN